MASKMGRKPLKHPNSYIIWPSQVILLSNPMITYLWSTWFCEITVREYMQTCMYKSPAINIALVLVLNYKIYTANRHYSLEFYDKEKYNVRHLSPLRLVAISRRNPSLFASEWFARPPGAPLKAAVHLMTQHRRWFEGRPTVTLNKSYFRLAWLATVTSTRGVTQYGCAYIWVSVNDAFKD